MRNYRQMDDEILFHRGVRVTDYTWMLSAFQGNNLKQTKKGGLNSDQSVVRTNSCLRGIPSMRETDKSFLKWQIEPLECGRSLEASLHELTSKIMGWQRRIQMDCMARLSLTMCGNIWRFANGFST